jgi:hypothetical protein
MSSTQIAVIPQVSNTSTKSMLVATGLAFASLILVPALATSMGMGPSLTGALRIALMKASSRAIGGKNGGDDASATSFSCH